MWVQKFVSFLIVGIVSLSAPCFGQPIVPPVAQTEIKVAASAHNPLTRFAVRKLKKNLAKAGYTPGEPAVTVDLREAAGVPQSYSIHRNGSVVTVTGSDDRGLMYGILRLAEEVKLGTPIARVRDEAERPFIQIRAFKFNLPLPGTLYVSPRNLKNNQWFWDLGYWRKFLDQLAEDRFDALEFWSAEPWGQMVSLKKYPKATSLSAAEMRRHIKFFKTLFHMAKVRGIDTYLVTWNIDLNPAFARAHHLPVQNVNSHLVRSYLRDCIRSMLTTYPDLTGLGTTQGEDMGVVPADQRGGWIADVYFRAIRESGRKNLPFIFRYWGGTPADTEKAAATYTLGPVYLDIKYNGEDVYSSPMYHVQNSAWLTQKHSYQFLWHLRNDALFSFRWGNPEFVRELMHDMKQTNPAGLTYGSEENIPGPESYDTLAARAVRPWPYEFQKQWFLFALWGRLGYNPDLSDNLWRKYFRYEYGSAGDALYDCTVAAGRIAPLITSFHWNYMNGDWMPEGSIGSWNTSSEQPRKNYRRYQMYHSILDYIFNNTIDSNYENIVHYAAHVLAAARSIGNAATPLDVANGLEQDGREALAAALISPPGKAYQDRFQAAQSDDEAYGRLALYYAEKLRGATDLALFIFSGKPSYQTAAVGHLEKSLAEWHQLVAITQKHYLPREIWQMGDFHWSMYTDAVANDIAIAHSVHPVVVTEQMWQVRAMVATASGVHAWRTVTLHNQQPFGAAGLLPWLLYANSLFSAPAAERMASQSSVSRGPQTVASFLWKRSLRPAPAGEEWALAFPGREPAKVTFKGRPVQLPEANISHTSVFRMGYLVYPLGGKGGEVQVDLPPGAVPEITAIAKAHTMPIDLSPARAQVEAPLTKTTNGVFSMPDTANLAAFTASGVLPEVDTAGSILFHFRTPEPGFYRVQCLLHAGKHTRSLKAFFAVDEYNGNIRNVLFPQHGYSRARHASASRGWKPAAEYRPLPLGAGEHTLRIYLRQPGEEVKQVSLIATVE